MGKKNKPQKMTTLPINATPPRPLLSRRGKIVIAAGVAAVILGFWLVTFTDPAGRNWASRLCPFVILGGYAIIGIGIVVPDPEPSDAFASSK